MISLSIVVLVLALGFGAAWWVLDQPPCIKRRVVVQLKADPDVGYQGVLWSSRGSWLTLRNVTALRDGREATAVPGEAVFPRAEVLFLQVLPGGEG